MDDTYIFKLFPRGNRCNTEVSFLFDKTLPSQFSDINMKKCAAVYRVVLYALSVAGKQSDTKIYTRSIKTSSNFKEMTSASEQWISRNVQLTFLEARTS